MDRIATEDKIKEMLLHADYPVKAKEIAAMLEISEREVRRLVRELIGRGVMIASTMERPYGYFIPKNEQQVERYARQLKSRIAKIAERLHDFDQATAAKLQSLLFPDGVV